MNLLKTLATISGMTMLSRITGLIRDVLIASAFGATGHTDAYNIAFRIPNLLRRVFAEGAFAQAFVPILAQYKSQQGHDVTKHLVDHVATLLTWVLVITCVVGVVAAPAVVYMVATGFHSKPQIFDLAVVMTRIMFPYIGFMSLVALAGGILNTWREFKIPAFTPVLLNLSSIAGSLLLAPLLKEPIYALAIAVFVGGVLQLAIQVPALVKIGMMPAISLNPLPALRDSGVRRVLINMGPAIFAVSASQISILINSNLASRLQEGSISWLGYADRLMEFPTALLGVALGTILLPSLSKANADGDHAEYSALLDWGLRLTFLLAMPSAVGLATLSEPLTASLFHYHQFSADAVHKTATALIAYGAGLIGLIVVKILAPGFYAKQDIKTPVMIAVGVMLATQMMNYLFVPKLAHAGLALSVGLGACINAGFLYIGLTRKGIYQPQKGWLLFLIKLIAALFLMAGVALSVAGHFDWITMQATPVKRLLALALVLASCGIVYFGALLIMGFRPRDFRKVARV
ncbi:murein biosynthesis integral membrane protein MurJ [Undibacterium terreum]|uniref:Probable lipid II flippase MurJ n=1 Tax=Undibacterium terreum TaxID=1224302 RepID=A0A916UUM6_9BURK|nr:murein biosynthesis integral membrane protein MurJ [Undibacterium terreum]GGC85853.1 putative lipid II flippase MurJ [Undibacterium terreum]